MCVYKKIYIYNNNLLIYNIYSLSFMRPPITSTRVFLNSFKNMLERSEILINFTYLIVNDIFSLISVCKHIAKYPNICHDKVPKDVGKERNMLVRKCFLIL